jgi:DNA primase
VIAQETLDRVRRDANVVEIVGESVKLTKRGRSFVGLCPFHKEKTPSFHVNPERGFYHCFGCHASGDAIKFIQETEGLDFIEAVRRIAERMGIDIVETASDAERRQHAEVRRRQQELYDVNTAAAAYFEKMLREHPLRDVAERELERRALVAASPTDAIADALQAFRVGYAPYGWDGLATHCRETGVALAAAEKVGLVAPRKSGSGYYDRFRHRLMFAVIDVQGRVIAFSGRSLDEPAPEKLRAAGLEPSQASEPPAKYMNSPESPVYRKRETVFGLYQARQALRTADRAVIVEGNFDVLSLHARGIKTAVAPLGTAFTVEQARAIRRFTPNVTLLFDPDEAGRRAVRAAHEVIREAGVNALVATLPAGMDPDELVRRQGLDQARKVIEAAQPIMSHRINELLDEEFRNDDPATQIQKVEELMAFINAEPDPAVRGLADGHAMRLLGRLRITHDQDSSLRQVRGRMAATVRRHEEQSPEKRPQAPPQPPHRARSRDQREELALELLGALLDFPELLDGPEAEQAAVILDGDAAMALAAMRQARQEGAWDPQVMLAKAAAPIHAFALARWAAPRHERLADAKAELVGNLRKLLSLEWSREKEEVLLDLERAEKVGELDEKTLRRYFEGARKRRGMS